MRTFSLLVIACLMSGWAHAQEPSGISSSVLSRCAGKVGSDNRRADPAFATIALDGFPWMTVEQADATVGSQQISTTVSSTGWRRRRDGTSVSFRFTCMLDREGHALGFHVSNLMRNLGDRLPPSLVVEGAASYLEKIPLPRGVELQVQLLDTSKSSVGEILAEQVVRSGWQVPIPFALRVPKENPLTERKLAITARFVLGGQILFKLEEPRAIGAEELHKFIILTLDRVQG